jgi:hypothetical protein
MIPGMAPKWATRLLERVFAERGVPAPSLGWSRARGKESSGSAKAGPRPAILVRAGSSLLDQRAVLLHEAAHVLTGCRHDEAFWKAARGLYRAHGVARHAGRRDARYRTCLELARDVCRLWSRAKRKYGPGMEKFPLARLRKIDRGMRLVEKLWRA